MHARTREAIGNVQQAERSTTGMSTMSSGKTSVAAGLEGLDYRLKGEDRLKEKVAEAIRDNPDATPEEVVHDIPDTIRYTFCIQAENYTAGYWDIKDRLEAHGYEMYLSKNSWQEEEYKGINTRWLTPDGERFEVQFHTPESYHAKQDVTHQAYERARNPLTSKKELQELKAFQREVSSWIPVPSGATDIPAYRRKGF